MQPKEDASKEPAARPTKKTAQLDQAVTNNSSPVVAASSDSIE